MRLSERVNGMVLSVVLIAIMCFAWAFSIRLMNAGSVVGQAMVAGQLALYAAIAIIIAVTPHTQSGGSLSIRTQAMGMGLIGTSMLVAMTLLAQPAVNWMQVLGYALCVGSFLLLIGGAFYTAFRPNHWPA